MKSDVLFTKPEVPRTRARYCYFALTLKGFEILDCQLLHGETRIPKTLVIGIEFFLNFAAGQRHGVAKEPKNDR